MELFRKKDSRLRPIIPTVGLLAIKGVFGLLLAKCSKRPRASRQAAGFGRETQIAIMISAGTAATFSQANQSPNRK